MTRIFLRALNAPVLILLTIFGIALQTSLFQSWLLQYMQPDVVLIVVVWCALRRSFTEGGIITLIIANASEIHSAAPQGLFLITTMAVYLLIRGISRVFVIPNLSSLVIVTLVASIFWKLAGLGILSLLGASNNQWRHTLMFLSPGALIEGALGLWLFRWLERFDWVTHRHLRKEQALEDELLLDGSEL